MSYRYSMLADHSYYQYQPYQAHHISNVVNNDNMRPYYTVCHVLCTSNSNTIYAIYIYMCRPMYYNRGNNAGTKVYYLGIGLEQIMFNFFSFD